MKQSESRTKLIAAIDRLADLTRQRVALEEKRPHLQTVVEAEHAAQAELGRIVEADAQDAAAWARNGAIGNAPAPDKKVRTTAAKALEAARHAASGAQAALADLSARIREINIQIGPLDATLIALRRATLVEEVETLATGYRSRAITLARDNALILAAAGMLQPVDPATCVRLQQATFRSPTDPTEQALHANARVVLARFTAALESHPLAALADACTAHSAPEPESAAA